jgi:hypothetical protein
MGMRRRTELIFHVAIVNAKIKLLDLHVTVQGDLKYFERVLKLIRFYFF